jgi:hypothetical protein
MILSRAQQGQISQHRWMLSRAGQTMLRVFLLGFVLV